MSINGRDESTLEEPDGVETFHVRVHRIPRTAND